MCLSSSVLSLRYIVYDCATLLSARELIYQESSPTLDLLLCTFLSRVLTSLPRTLTACGRPCPFTGYEPNVTVAAGAEFTRSSIAALAPHPVERNFRWHIFICDDERLITVSRAFCESVQTIFFLLFRSAIRHYSDRYSFLCIGLCRIDLSRSRLTNRLSTGVAVASQEA